VAQVDRGVRARRYLSRSAAVEEALRQLERAGRDREIEAYYAGRSTADRDEERAWGALGAEALARGTRAGEARAAYGVRRGGPRAPRSADGAPDGAASGGRRPRGGAR
jgi:Arc/MetJ-type ribon-helix-helix transcriptional regulator